MLNKLKSAVQASFIWLLAPVMNSRRDSLSLGRLLLFLYTLGLINTLAFHMPVLIALGPSATVLLCVVFLVLAAYCFGDKPWVRETILTLAGRVPTVGASNLSEITRYEPPAPPPQPAGSGPIEGPAKQSEIHPDNPGI